MGHLVLDESGAMGEGFATVFAHVGFLSSVDPLVLSEVRTAFEGLPTLNALM